MRTFRVIALILISVFGFRLGTAASQANHPPRTSGVALAQYGMMQIATVGVPGMQLVEPCIVYQCYARQGCQFWDSSDGQYYVARRGDMIGCGPERPVYQNGNMSGWRIVFNPFAD